MVRALARADHGSPGSDLGPARSGALRENAAGLLFDRHTAEASLQPQALGDLVIEISDDDRSHGVC
jgi:hypothetical protein